MVQSLDKISREFRAAVLAGDHVLAGQLASEYTGAICTEDERAQASELLTWAHRMTLVQRAIAAAQLAVIEKASHYNAEAPIPAVQFSA